MCHCQTVSRAKLQDNTLGMLCVHHRGGRHKHKLAPTGHLEFPLHSAWVSSDCGRKPEHKPKHKTPEHKLSCVNVFPLSLEALHVSRLRMPLPHFLMKMFYFIFVILQSENLSHDHQAERKNWGETVGESKRFPCSHAAGAAVILSVDAANRAWL